MKPKKAVETFWHYYHMALGLVYVEDKTAWALYQTWKEAANGKTK